jgi:drug/metabolite transporter (DMT)-like permease
MLEQLAPLPILAGSLCYSFYLYGSKAGRSKTGMQRAAEVVLILSGLGFALLYWATTGLGHDRDAAIRFVLATVLWSGLLLTISREETATRDARRPVSPVGSRSHQAK